MLPGEKFRIQDNVQKCFWTILGNFYNIHLFTLLVELVNVTFSTKTANGVVLTVHWEQVARA